MKSFLTLFSLLIFTSVFAQKSLELPITKGVITINQMYDELNVRGDARIRNNVAKLSGGTLKGNFLGKKRPFICVINNSITVRGMEEEFCYTTNVIDVSKMAEVSFSMDISGTGTLDKHDAPNGQPLHDWIDISYILDDEKTHLGDGNHTMEGIPSNFAKSNIEIAEARKFQIEICMRTTGGDEQYTVNDIKVEFQERENKPVVVDSIIKNKKESIITVSTSSNASVLVVFPNPTTNYLEIKNSENYDLETAVIFDATGKLVQLKNSYPFDLTGLPAGTYFLKCLEKESKSTVTTTFIIAQN